MSCDPTQLEVAQARRHDVTAFPFDNTFARELEGFYVPWRGMPVPEPRLLCLNHSLAAELGLDAAALDSPLGAEIFTGVRIPEGAAPLAQAYAGHQFGGFSPQLGDGRALLLGELIDRQGQRRDIQLKGSGPTPFSRGGDGKAAVGPVLREHLIGEAMHALGVPTTRALASAATGETVRREVGLPGAVLTRVAASHIRVGTFQFFASRGETEKVRRLADYTIARHYPELSQAERPYLAFLQAVSDAQARLIARWMQLGFIHGVMNTDNMALSGETIDYGPCAYLDAYDPATVFSSIDARGRYAYGKQPAIAQWNLARLTETLLELLAPETEAAIAVATPVVEGFADVYAHHWLEGMRAKVGLHSASEEDQELVDDLLSVMATQRADFTLMFRRLADAVRGDTGPLRSLLTDPAALDAWLPRWQTRREREEVSPQARATAMDRVNPLYIPRNHKVEEALGAATISMDLAPFRTLLEVLENPFVERPEWAQYAEPAPASFGSYRTFCGT